MPLGNPKGGIGYGAEFQSSALPWVTSSIAPNGAAIGYDFPKVTRFITVTNLGMASSVLSFGFTKLGMTSANSNKFILSGTQSVTLETRVRSLWVQGEGSSPTFSLFAGLTTVDSGDMPVLSGSLPDGTPGWPGIG